MEENFEDHSESEDTQTENSEVEEGIENLDDTKEETKDENTFNESSESDTPKSGRKKIKLKRKKKSRGKQYSPTKDIEMSANFENKPTRTGNFNDFGLHDPSEEEAEINLLHQGKNVIKLIPFKILLFIILLYFISFLLLLLGCTKDIQSLGSMYKYLCWIMSLIALLPGLYYTFKIIRVAREKDPKRRESMANQII
ncbi:unnamed protein product [Moneuplotes crassus]|uniref:Transmembrane protein n=1 Tax=Euplotes crassus TaxID=5936 RepID=A0AAD1XSQ1_EUPCR|nr:unnamed protein product [Moneuplotes crassus]